MYALKSNVFHNIYKITIINLNDNHLKYLEADFLKDLDIGESRAQNFQICCIKPLNSKCSAPTPWFFSCKKLLPNFCIKLMFILLLICIYISNIVSILILKNEAHRRIRTVKNVYQVIKCSVCIDNFAYGVYLTIIIIADIYYGMSFGTNDEKWKTSFPCSLAFLLILIFQFTEPLLLAFLALSKLMVTKYPLDTRFKETKFSLKCITTVVGVTVSISTGDTLIIGVSSGIPNSLCLPFVDPTDTLWFDKIPHFVPLNSSDLFNCFKCFFFFLCGAKNEDIY